MMDNVLEDSMWAVNQIQQQLQTQNQQPQNQMMQHLGKTFCFVFLFSKKFQFSVLKYPVVHLILSFRGIFSLLVALCVAVSLAS